MNTAALVIMFAILVVSEVVSYRRSPQCHWCQSRHYGRCMFNPKAGRLFANTNDGYFDVNDPNK